MVVSSAQLGDGQLASTPAKRNKTAVHRHSIMNSSKLRGERACQRNRRSQKLRPLAPTELKPSCNASIDADLFYRVERGCRKDLCHSKTVVSSGIVLFGAAKETGIIEKPHSKLVMTPPKNCAGPSTVCSTSAPCESIPAQRPVLRSVGVSIVTVRPCSAQRCCQSAGN